MDYAQRISSLVLSLRKKEKLRVRQPLQKILLPILDEKFKGQVELIKDLVLSEVNVKEIEYLTDGSGFIKKKVKANFKSLGSKLGKNMKSAAQMISEMTQDDIATLEKNNSFSIIIEGQAYQLTLEDIEISTDEIPGWQVATDRDITVALDITLTEGLINEGIARELINRIQNIRKQSDYDVTDRIKVTVESNDVVDKAIESYSDFISAEVLADSIETSHNIKGEKIDIIDEIQIAIQVMRV